MGECAPSKRVAQFKDNEVLDYLLNIWKKGQSVKSSWALESVVDELRYMKGYNFPILWTCLKDEVRKQGRAGILPTVFRVCFNTFIRGWSC